MQTFTFWHFSARVSPLFQRAIGCCLFVCLAWSLDIKCAQADGATNDQIIQAFADTSGGFSSDELLINDSIRKRFLAAVANERTLSAEEERRVLLDLLRLRKTGKLTAKATRRGPRVKPEVASVAEIAVRVVADRHRATIDTILADPGLRKELQSEAEAIQPKVDAYSVRKSVLQLRKKRALKPELVLRVADWDREVRTASLSELRTQLKAGQVPKQPGVYLFRSPEGYLYIGEAANLTQRLQQHITASDRPSLATYLSGEQSDKVSVELHVFPSDSPAKQLTVRRAYESELIRSRNPKFNTRP